MAEMHRHVLFCFVFLTITMTEKPRDIKGFLDFNLLSAADFFRNTELVGSPN